MSISQEIFIGGAKLGAFALGLGFFVAAADRVSDEDKVPAIIVALLGVALGAFAVLL